MRVAIGSVLKCCQGTGFTSIFFHFAARNARLEIIRH